MPSAGMSRRTCSIVARSVAAQATCRLGGRARAAVAVAVMRCRCGPPSPDGIRGFASLSQSLISSVLSHAVAREEDHQLSVFPRSGNSNSGGVGCAPPVVVEVQFEPFRDDELSGEYSEEHRRVLAGAPNPFELYRADLASLGGRMQALLATDNPRLAEVVTYMFEETQGGKKVRPVITGAIAAAVNHHEKVAAGRATPHSSGAEAQQQQQQQQWAAASPAQLRLGEVAELIHMASLLHDDVLDMADTRRGAESINERFGNKMAVMTGDFFLSRAISHLARLGSADAVALVAQLISDLVKGEIMQMRGLHAHKGQTPFQAYVRKTYYKTGALIANSCKAAAVLGSADPEVRAHLRACVRACVCSGAARMHSTFDVWARVVICSWSSGWHAHVRASYSSCFVGGCRSTGGPSSSESTSASRSSWWMTRWTLRRRRRRWASPPWQT
jgi:geranylgeranyl pyrophosphate synthase